MDERRGGRAWYGDGSVTADSGISSSSSVATVSSEKQSLPTSSAVHGRSVHISQPHTLMPTASHYDDDVVADNAAETGCRCQGDGTLRRFPLPEP